MAKHLVRLGDRLPDVITHQELDAAVRLLPGDVHAEWVGTDTPAAQRTGDADGLWVVPGGPYRNDVAVYRRSPERGRPDSRFWERARASSTP